MRLQSRRLLRDWQMCAAISIDYTSDVRIRDTKSLGGAAGVGAGYIYNGTRASTACRQLDHGPTYAIKSDWQTVTEKRQMQQSVTFVFLLRLGVFGASPPSSCSCFRALVLPSATASVRLT